MSNCFVCLKHGGFLGRADVAPGPNEPAEGENCNGNIEENYVVRCKGIGVDTYTVATLCICWTYAAHFESLLAAECFMLLQSIGTYTHTWGWNIGGQFGLKLPAGAMLPAAASC